MALGYSTVRVNITALVIDGVDADDLPDDVALSATLTLEPMIQKGRMLQYTEGGVAKLKALTAIGPVDIGPFGDISDRNRDYVKIPAPTSAETNLAELQWKAVFDNPKYGTKPVKIDDIYFYSVPGAEINLADHINVAPSSIAVQITRGPRGFGVVDVQNEDNELVFFAGPEADPAAWTEAGRVTAPTAAVSNTAVAPLVANPGVTREAVDSRVKTVGDQTYASLEAAAGLSEVVDSKLSKAVADQTYVPVPASDGTAGQVLAKTSTGTAWVAPPSGGSGASLTKDTTTGMYVIGSGSSLTKDATTGMYPIGA